MSHNITNGYITIIDTDDNDFGVYMCYGFHRREDEGNEYYKIFAVGVLLEKGIQSACNKTELQLMRNYRKNTIGGMGKLKFYAQLGCVASQMV